MRPAAGAAAAAKRREIDPLPPPLSRSAATLQEEARETLSACAPIPAQRDARGLLELLNECVRADAMPMAPPAASATELFASCLPAGRVADGHVLGFHANARLAGTWC